MHWSAILWAGFIATTLAAAFLWVFRNLEWTEFSPATQIGCVFFDNPRLPAAEGVGLLTLYLLGSSLVPAVYRGVLGAVGGVTWGSGALLGLVHGMLMVAALPYVAKVSVCVRNGRIPPPGRLGLAWGKGTPVGIVLGHALYGGVLGAALAAFAAPPQLMLPR